VQAEQQVVFAVHSAKCGGQIASILNKFFEAST
jgi:hypothetical protein